MTTSNPRPLLEEVFKLSGVPTYTFVEPQEYGRLVVALRTPGRGVVIEGPSGIGKTTAVTKALAELPGGSDALRLSARSKNDLDLIAALPEMRNNGTVVIDDFHRLPDDLRSNIADYLKLLADEEDKQNKIVILGINRAGESLIRFARDLAGRLDVIKFEPTSPERIRMLVREGAAALNIEMPEVAIAERATGSFHIAQLLCHQACLASEIRRSSTTRKKLSKGLPVVMERVMDDLSMSFMEIALTFATGVEFSREGRAPYLQILRWLSGSSDWTINLDREIQRHPESASAVRAVINPHLPDFISKNEDIAAHIHFDRKTRILAVEDPKFFFFIKNLEWAKFAERVGYLNVGFQTQYDFALSFAGVDRDIAEALHDELVRREFAVFYDFNEQARILASDLEEYLAPIYQSEASFVLCVMSEAYPSRVWTRFESKQFGARFGTESVIPIWVDTSPGAFHEAGRFGSFFINRAVPIEEQVLELAGLLKDKLAEYRLKPRLRNGEFLCRHCHLVLDTARLANGRTAVCFDCAERSRIV